MADQAAEIRTEAELRQLLAAPPERLTSKIQPRLEAVGRSWIEQASLVGLTTRRADGSIEVGLRASAGSAAHAPNDFCIEIDNRPETRHGVADENLEVHPFAGVIFMLPGENSTLRANGALRSAGSKLTLEVSETFMHCPKAFVRSRLWNPDATRPSLAIEEECGSELGEQAQAFLSVAPFLLIGSCLHSGQADISPRGDPPGFVQMIDSRTLLIPDRPGNNIADTFRNLLENPEVGLLLLVPGFDWALQVSGRATLTTAAEVLASMAVQGKTPKLAIRVDVKDSRLAPATALATAQTWKIPSTRPRVPTLGRTLVEQVEPQGRFRGIKGRLLERALRRDAKKNLY